MSFFVVSKTVIGVNPASPILYLLDQVWTGAVLSRFVRDVMSVEGTCFMLGALWGLTNVVAG